MRLPCWVPVSVSMKNLRCRAIAVSVFILSLAFFAWADSIGVRCAGRDFHPLEVSTPLIYSTDVCTLRSPIEKTLCPVLAHRRSESVRAFDRLLLSASSFAAQPACYLKFMQRPSSAQL
ncbi:hypothetical protein C8R45DRAFT_319765 [Mycena sanguinolenta]|nr:hypothetical protein C8R45DRAFT_319765 [Mycena sanguinolenta]